MRRPPVWALVGLLVAVHLAVAFAVRPNPRWNDAIYVLNYARDYPDVPLNHHALRIGNLLPARVLVTLFGYGQVAYYAWPLLMGILLVAATFALARELFGRWTAFAAGLLVIFHPVLVTTEIRFGTERMASWHLLPDIPSTALLTTGLALLLWARPPVTDPESDTATDKPVGGRGPLIACLLAGLCFGWAYLVRELSVFVFPVIAGVLVAWRFPVRRWLQVAAPMLGCLVAEMVLSALVYGEPLARLTVGAEHGIVPQNELTRLDAILRFPRTVLGYPQAPAVLATLALTVLGAVVLRRKGHVLILGWFLSVWVPLTLVSGFLNPELIRINASLMRYWIPVLPALCIGAAAAVASLLAVMRDWASGRSWASGDRAGAVSATVAVVTLALWCVPLLNDIATNPRDRYWNSIRAYLQDQDEGVEEIVTDTRDALTLGVYQYRPLGGQRAWEAEITAVPHGQNLEPTPEGPGTALLWTPQLSRRPPPVSSGWEVVVDHPELKLYRAAGEPPEG